MPVLLYFVGPKRPSDNCYVSCFLTDKIALDSMFQKLCSPVEILEKTIKIISHWLSTHTTPPLLFSWYQEIKEESSESVSGVKLEESFFDDQLEDGGDIFIIRDEYDRQTILRPRRKFSWWMKQKCRSFSTYFVKYWKKKLKYIPIFLWLLYLCNTFTEIKI